MFHLSRFLVISSSVFWVLLFPILGFCATVDLTWDKPADTSSIAGYKIYTAYSGSSFPDEATKVITNPDQTTCSIDGLIAGKTYGFAATSFDGEGNESPYSNELYYTVPTSTQDSDGDGLTDEEEEHYGLDPTNPDTNGNGISDQDEVDLWGNAWDGDLDGDGTINLFDLDADGDGVSDATELVQETDPADGSDNESGLPTMVFGEVPVDSDWTTVKLNKTFQNPVVVAGPLSSNDSQPAVVRIRNISGNSFDIRAQEYEYLEQAHTQENISFLVMEMGSYYLPDGTQIEASYFEAKANHASFDTVSFTSQFAVQPVVMTSIATVNDQLAVTGRAANVSTSGFDYALQPEEFSANDHAQESVAYIAWEPSQGEIDGTQFAVAKAHDLIHTAQQIDIEQNFTSAPSFLASMQTCDGGDTANLRYTEKSARGLKMNVAEEQSLDDEIRHTTEDVGFIALNSQTKEVVYAVNRGGDAYTDSNGVSYNADQNYTYGKTYKSSSNISGTEADPIYTNRALR